ncbi:hypothetical protein GQ457_01G041250 [Hibiscus cannabinus]
MEGRKTGMILSVCIMVVAGFATGTTAMREDAGAIPPSPMESGGVAVGVPAALAVLASMYMLNYFSRSLKHKVTLETTRRPRVTASALDSLGY